jgi:hypothetical protein
MRSIVTMGLACAVVLAAAVTVNAQGGQGRGGNQAPPENLQVLPKTMTRQEVTALMRSFTAALGVQCNHCHVGSPAERAKDDLPTKATARKMLQMVMAINNDLLKDVGAAPADGARRVTCYSCHRGALKVATAPPAAGGGF